MKHLWFTLLLSGLALPAAELAGVQAVYVMPMSHGMDQFLANRIANQHVFRVVTDPKLADAIITDHVGESLRSELEELMPNPEPVKHVEPEKDPKGPPPSLVAMMADPEGHTAPQHSTLGRGKGTIFLVDLKSHQVLWSVFDPSKGMDSKEMDRTASDIVSRLSKDLNPPKK